MSEQETVEVSKEDPTQQEQSGADTTQEEQAAGEQGTEQTEGGEQQTEDGGEQAEASEQQEQSENVGEAAEDGTQQEAVPEPETQQETQEETEGQGEQTAEATEDTQAEQGQVEDTQAEQGQVEDTQAEGQTEDTQAEQGQVEDTQAEQGQVEDTQAEQSEQEQADDTQGELEPIETQQQNGDVQAMSDLGLSKKQFEKLNRCFKENSDNGRIDFSQFKRLMRQLGQNFTTADTKEIYNKAQQDNEGKIDMEEFCRIFAENQVPEEEQELEILRCVDTVFPGNTQCVPLPLLKKMVERLGTGNLALSREESCLSKDDLESVLSEMDQNGNGMIDKLDFAKFLVAREKSEL